jgi:hypothetical protein
MLVLAWSSSPAVAGPHFQFVILSEAKNLSVLAPNRREILRFAQNDNRRVFAFPFISLGDRPPYLRCCSAAAET